MLITVKCHYCGKDKQMEKREYKRRIKNGKTKFFCNSSCTAIYYNALRKNRRVKIEKICLCCKKYFITLTGAKSKVHCSRECASKNSVTDERRRKAREAGKRTKNLISPQETLKRREAWKYKKLKKLLKKHKEDFEFEYKCGKYIFDLALIKRKLLIEFDGPEHKTIQIKVLDKPKTAYAKRKGWTIIRIPVKANQGIKANVLFDIL